jgi:isopropylmalate/homocitrate/citramalate synthase
MILHAMRVTLCDVGPRDGLQNDPVALEPSVRAELCRRLAATGLPRVEAASFVHPELVPQMAGAEEVFAALDGEATFAALVLNRKGLERAIAAGAGEIHYAYPLTDTFAARNQNTTVEEAAQTAAAIVARAHDAGLRATVTLGVAFGCPFEGEVDPGVVADHAARMAAAGADELMLADTIGVAVPRQVGRLVEATRGDVPVGLHLHNTRNTGYANAAAGLEHGVTLFDASVGGLGGCPFAPRATGNIATEDLLYMLDREGIESGVDLDALIAVAEWLGGVLGRDLPGLLHRAGRFPG